MARWRIHTPCPSSVLSVEQTSPLPGNGTRLIWSPKVNTRCCFLPNVDSSMPIMLRLYALIDIVFVLQSLHHASSGNSARGGGHGRSFQFFLVIPLHSSVEPLNRRSPYPCPFSLCQYINLGWIYLQTTIPVHFRSKARHFLMFSTSLMLVFSILFIYILLIISLYLILYVCWLLQFWVNTLSVHLYSVL